VNRIKFEWSWVIVIVVVYKFLGRIGVLKVLVGKNEQFSFSMLSVVRKFTRFYF
jgi:hypothetical protein